MSSARIFYYPDSSKSLEEIDLLTDLSDIQDTPIAIVEDGVSLTGDSERELYRSTMGYHVTLERFDGGTSAGRALARHLFSFQAAIDKGYPFGLVRDASKAVAAFSLAGKSRYDTSIATNGNLFAAYNASAGFAAADEVLIQSAPSLGIREMCTVDSVSGATVVLNTGLRYTYDDPLLIRSRDFFPVCYRPQDEVSRPILTSDRRLSYTLDLTFVELLAALFTLSSVSGSTLQPATFAQGKLSLQDLLAQQGSDYAATY